MPFLALGTASPLGDLVGLVTGSSLLGKLVLLLLFLMSVFSWALMAERGRRLRQAAKANAGFWKQFRAGHEDPASLERLAFWAEQNPMSPLAAVFTYFSRDFWPSYGKQRGGDERLSALSTVLARGVDRVASAQMTGLERGVGWLATFTSTAPFIGLLGTVYGILGSFLEIGRQGSASLDAVGPGIAESLVATVAGLAVAIPAAVAYNFFVGKLRQHDDELQALSAQLGDLLAREELGVGSPLRERSVRS